MAPHKNPPGGFTTEMPSLIFAPEQFDHLRMALLAMIKPYVSVRIPRNRRRLNRIADHLGEIFVTGRELKIRLSPDSTRWRRDRFFIDLQKFVARNAVMAGHGQHGNHAVFDQLINRRDREAQKFGDFA